MSVPISTGRRFAGHGFLCGLLVWSNLYAAVPSADYDAVIIAARNGQTAPAILKLQAWHDAYPDDRRIVYDLAAVFQMAGQPENGLKYFKQILQPDAPAYALKAIALSARIAGRPEDAEAAYRLLLSKTPNDAEAHAGLAYAWIAQDRIQVAFEYVEAHLPKWPKKAARTDVPLLVVLAELHEKRKNWLQAAAAYQDVLRFDPGFRYALRGRASALNSAGLPLLAKRLVDDHPDAFSAEETQHFAHDAVAHTIGFGEAQLAVDDSSSRFAATDLALQENSAVLQQFGPLSKTRFDRLVALHDRVKMHEVLELYESLRAANIVLPPYAKFMVADAYLFLQQPESARDLYLEGFKDSSAAPTADTLNWQVSLVYAYGEAEQHEEANALIDRLLRGTPNIDHKGIPGIETASSDYARVQLLRASQYLYGDRLAEAEKRLAEMRAAAPHNFDVRAAWASLQNAREHPRAALEELVLLQIDEPQSTANAAARGETLLALNREAEAKAVLASLLETQPENRDVQKFAQKLAVHDMPVLRVDSTFGHGQSAAVAESLLDASIYSAPLTTSLGDPYRVFARLTRADGHADSEAASRARLGVGLDFRERDVTAEAELNRSVGVEHKTGLLLALSLELSDHWSGRAALDTNVIDLPAAAMRAGVTAESLKANLTWTLDESRKAGGELSRIRFSDGNERDAARFWWMERWISGPIFKLDTVLSVATSTNSLGSRAYFNPTRDQDLSLDTKVEWLTWRRYQRAFKQRMTVSVGQYWQDGFGRGTAADLYYEHEWSWDDMKGLRYGLGHAFHPYDGVRDSRNYAYFGFYGRFK